MKRGTEHELIRLLHGELPPGDARELRLRLLREPELAEAFRRLEATWRSLEPPPAAAVPPGFTGRVLSQVRRQPAPAALSWAAAPVWVRATAAAALIGGAALGVGVGRILPVADTATAEAAPSSSTTTASSIPAEPAGADYSLAEGYWDVMNDATSSSDATEVR
jgi:anti-sigma factor RsiW